ncbi:MAG: replication-relaxation family protein [Gordonia sp. (in: high G+C Gram-positive bacteria)]|uniref:replication-relaxation family protein n=1 Tax=Gordonia sp. (in: high G+C Gram-positive bacteria) TaxID=84139 RepID=UPI0039E396C3
MNGRPIGRPTANGSERPEVVFRGESGQIRATKDGVPSSTPVRISGRRLEEIAKLLSERDTRLLELVDRLRFAAAKTLHALVNDDEGTSERSTRRALGKLVRIGLLAPLPRRVGGLQSGSTGLVVHLTNAGDRLVRQRQGRSTRRRFAEPSTRFVQHCLDIGDALTCLTNELPVHGLTLSDWEAEPTSWRRHQRGSSTVTLKPDIYVEVERGNDIWGYFIEVDRGSESIPTVMRQLSAYEDYRHTGTEQDRYGAFPPVVITLYEGARTKPNVRAEQLTAAIHQDRRIPDRLVCVTEAEELSAVVADLCQINAEVQS